ncbi:putative ribosomal protein L2 [Trypanosoma cruzi]|uniref:Putative ribosomal protein L2 n=1 Tax=Trypanosoma cruzi TaxID=5693 RepID=A0A2V2W0L2_TRYCR|nr:putative ribosomal protein L2 [Trypanosoma cruzi]
MEGRPIFLCRWTGAFIHGTALRRSTGFLATFSVDGSITRVRRLQILSPKHIAGQIVIPSIVKYMRSVFFLHCVCALGVEFIFFFLFNFWFCHSIVKEVIFP